jgi:hypothetical protein
MKKESLILVMRDFDYEETLQIAPEGQIANN